MHTIKLTTHRLLPVSFFVLSLGACSSISQAPAPIESGINSTPMTPAIATSNPNDARALTHTVVQGETVYRISVRNNLKPEQVAAWNNLIDNKIVPGQVLRLTPPGSNSVAITRPISAPSINAVKPLPSTPAPSSEVVSIKTSPKALKLPYSVENTKVLIAQSGGKVVESIASKPATVVPSIPSSNTVKPSTPTKPVEPVTVAAPSEDLSATISLSWPTQGAVITPYSIQKKGIDIGGSMGQAILAAADGKVVYSGKGLRGYGNLLIIKHDKVFLTAYAHNSKLLFKEGQSVTRGQKIAEMGNSDTDQVKLHFEVRQYGKPVDPTKFLRQ